MLCGSNIIDKKCTFFDSTPSVNPLSRNLRGRPFHQRRKKQRLPDRRSGKRRKNEKERNRLQRRKRKERKNCSWELVSRKF